MSTLSVTPIDATSGAVEAVGTGLSDATDTSHADGGDLAPNRYRT